MSIRTVGIVGPDERASPRSTSRPRGGYRKCSSTTSASKKKGAPLLSIYSPQFLTTQQEYLDARKSGQTGVARLARRRLELWDVPSDEIEAMAHSGKAPPT